MPVPKNSPKIDRSPLRDDVYRRLREDIVSGGYSPGEQLRESEIEMRMGASRTPVREALSRLNADGFVDVLPQRETRVREVSGREIADSITVLRYVFGQQIGVAVATLDDDSMRQLRDYLELITSDSNAEIEAFTNGDALDCLLGVFFDAAQNHTLQRVGQAIALHLRWYANTAPGLASHLVLGRVRVGAIVRACEARDAALVGMLFDGWFAEVYRVLEGGGSLDSIDVQLPRQAAPTRQLLREQVYVVLLDALRRTAFASGERLREDHLMSWLGVSRVPLRDALGRLELIGLVETLPGRMTRVTVLNVERLSQTMAALGVFGSLAMLLGVPKVCVEDIAEIRATRERLDAALIEGDAVEGIAAVVDALMIVADASENQTLVTTLLSVCPWVYRRTQLQPDPELQLLGEVLAGVERGIEQHRPEVAAAAVVSFFDQVAARVRRATPVIKVDASGDRIDDGSDGEMPPTD